MKAPNRESLGMLLAFVGVVIFSGTVPATRLAVGGLDAYFVTAARAAMAGGIAAIVLAFLRRRWPDRSQLRQVALCALCFVAGFSGFIALGLRTVPASHGGVVLGIMPLMTSVAAAIILGERPSMRFWLFAVLGAFVVIVYALRDSGGVFDIGDVYLLAGALTGAIGHVYSGKLSREMPGWEVISWVLVISLPVMAPAALWLTPIEPTRVPVSAWAGLAYVTLFSMFIGFFAWNAGLAMAGVANASQVMLLQTFFTVGLSAIVNGEHIDPLTIVAAVAVVAAVSLGQRARTASPNPLARQERRRRTE